MKYRLSFFEGKSIEKPFVVTRLDFPDVEAAEEYCRFRAVELAKSLKASIGFTVSAVGPVSPALPDDYDKEKDPLGYFNS